MRCSADDAARLKHPARQDRAPDPKVLERGRVALQRIVLEHAEIGAFDAFDAADLVVQTQRMGRPERCHRRIGVDHQCHAGRQRTGAGIEPVGPVRAHGHLVVLVAPVSLQPTTSKQQLRQICLQFVEILRHRHIHDLVIHRVIAMDDPVAQIDGKFQVGY